MQSEPLLICGQCGRPQHAGETCAFCGARLPPPFTHGPASGRDRVLQAYQPFLEADLGLAKRIRLSARRLEWYPRSGQPVIAKVEQLERVSLFSRPVWESLAIGALVSIGFILSSFWLVRVVLALFILLAIAACFLQKRYSLVLKTRDGRALRFDLGIGARRAPVVQRIESVWDSLQPALKQLGIATSNSAVV
jgi:hypothetical protein